MITNNNNASRVHSCPCDNRIVDGDFGFLLSYANWIRANNSVPLEKWHCIPTQNAHALNVRINFARRDARKTFDDDHGLVTTPVPMATHSLLQKEIYHSWYAKHAKIYYYILRLIAEIFNRCVYILFSIAYTIKYILKCNGQITFIIALLSLWLL